MATQKKISDYVLSPRLKLRLVRLLLLIQVMGLMRKKTLLKIVRY